MELKFAIQCLDVATELPRFTARQREAWKTIKTELSKRAAQPEIERGTEIINAFIAGFEYGMQGSVAVDKAAEFYKEAALKKGRITSECNPTAPQTVDWSQALKALYIYYDTKTELNYLCSCAEFEAFCKQHLTERTHR